MIAGFALAWLVASAALTSGADGTLDAQDEFLRRVDEEIGRPLRASLSQRANPGGWKLQEKDPTTDCVPDGRVESYYCCLARRRIVTSLASLPNLTVTASEEEREQVAGEMAKINKLAPFFEKPGSPKFKAPNLQMNFSCTGGAGLDKASLAIAAVLLS